MTLKRTLALILPVAMACVTFGFYFGKRQIASTSEPSSLSSSDNCKKNPKVSDELLAKIEADLQSYYQMKTSDEKTKKGDDLLGRILLLFLSDLGIKLSDKTKLLATAATENSSSGPQATTGSTPNSRPSKGSDHSANEVTPPAGVDPAERKKKEAVVDELKSDSEISDFLKSVKFDRPEDHIRSFTDLNSKNRMFQLLIGDFEGTAKVQTKIGPTGWFVQVHFDAQFKGEIPTGSYLVKLSENGKTFSNSSGNGTVNLFKESSDSSALLMKASPTTFFQIYYVPHLDEFSGNVYERNHQEVMEYIGTVVLKRSR